MLMRVNDLRVGKIDLTVEIRFMEKTAVCTAGVLVASQRVLTTEEVCYINAEYAKELEDAAYERYLDYMADGEDYARSYPEEVDYE